jgi:hypothetical protein
MKLLYKAAACAAILAVSAPAVAGPRRGSSGTETTQKKVKQPRQFGDFYETTHCRYIITPEGVIVEEVDPTDEFVCGLNAA